VINEALWQCAPLQHDHLLQLIYGVEVFDVFTDELRLLMLFCCVMWHHGYMMLQKQSSEATGFCACYQLSRRMKVKSEVIYICCKNHSLRNHQ